jgi:hypothetical protein
MALYKVYTGKCMLALKNVADTLSCFVELTYIVVCLGGQKYAV